MGKLSIHAEPAIDASAHAYRYCMAERFPDRLSYCLYMVAVVRRSRHEGALVAVHVGRSVLLVRSSYRSEWNFPGGSIHRRETPEVAARRELAEEVGLTAYRLHSAGHVCGLWDGQRDRVHFFEMRLERLPQLQLDNREIVDARLVSVNELSGLALTGPVLAYLRRRSMG